MQCCHYAGKAEYSVAHAMARGEYHCGLGACNQHGLHGSASLASRAGPEIRSPTNILVINTGEYFFIILISDDVPIQLHILVNPESYATSQS